MAHPRLTALGAAVAVAAAGSALWLSARSPVTPTHPISITEDFQTADRWMRSSNATPQVAHDKGFSYMHVPDGGWAILNPRILLLDALKYHALFHVRFGQGCQVGKICAAWVLNAKPQSEWFTRTWSGDEFVLSREPGVRGDATESEFRLEHFSCTAGDQCTSMERQGPAAYTGSGPGDQVMVDVTFTATEYYIRVDCALCDARTGPGFRRKFSRGSIAFVGPEKTNFDIIDLKVAEMQDTGQ